LITSAGTFTSISAVVPSAPGAACRRGGELSRDYQGRLQEHRRSNRHHYSNTRFERQMSIVNLVFICLQVGPAHRLKNADFSSKYPAWRSAFPRTATVKVMCHNVSFFDIVRDTDSRRTILAVLSSSCQAGSGINLAVGYSMYFYTVANISKPCSISLVGQAIGIITSLVAT